MATKKKELGNQPSNGWPKINQGTHLTVKTFEDGSTELIWDDDQLLKEVIEATQNVLKPNVKAKAVQRKNKVTRSKLLNSVELSMETIEKAKKSSKKSDS